MAKSVFTGAHKIVVETLIEARRKAGLTQTELARRVGKDQTFISIIERSQRRVDVLEFYVLVKAMGLDPCELYGELASKLPADVTI